MSRTHGSVIFILAAIILSSCGKHCVTVNFPDGKTRVEAYGENIFRVTSVPAGCDFRDGISLMRDYGAKPVKIYRSDNDSSVTVYASESGMHAMIRKSDGSVRFYNADGELLTAEKSRSFSKIEVDGTSGWTVRQTFTSPEDEDFFGLGQHQADEWNYKGKNEELYQYNTKISVPFIVSSRLYGLLWDSNSFCRWGDPRDYARLGDVFTLFDKDGAEGALTGTYSSAAGERLVRRETALDQEFLEVPDCGKVRNAPDFPFNGAEVVFEGEIEPSESGLYHFYIYYAGYTKVFIDGEQMMPEIWRTAWNPNGRKFTASLEAGKRVPLRVEWKPDGDVSYCGLRVLSPVPEEERSQMSWWGEMQQQIDYYVMSGRDLDEVTGGYRRLTGKAQIMPKWALGYWQSRERYRSQEEVLSTLKEMRDRHIPVDNIVQDWQWWEDGKWGSHEFDSTRFPDPAAMVDSVHALGGRFMISVWPKFYTETEHFREFDEKGWIYRKAVTDSVEDWLGYQQSFYDAYDEGARKLFWNQMKDHLGGLGIDAWWMDASEPNIHDCTDMDYRKALCGPTALGSSTEYFNAYALMNAKAIYEGQREAFPDRRVFLLTRNGFAGLQRYSTASWSGDIGTRWEDMKAQISAGLNFSISGIPFWGQDIGGFSVENRFMKAESLYRETGLVNEDMKEWRELQARWHEWGIFCPLYRAHGQWPFREPYNVAPEEDEAYQAIVNADRLRYSMMPYIYSLAAKVHFYDYTIMRPLVMDFTGDRTARNIGDQFMFGNALMVCPVYAYGAREREVYLPDGQWYDFFTNEAREGGRFTAEAPFCHVPVYVKAGSIIPTGPDIEYTAEDDGSRLTISIYTGQDGEFRVYEDDGLTYGYERGEYAWFDIFWDDNAGELTLDTLHGDFPGLSREKSVTVRFISPDGISEQQLTYSGSRLTCGL